MKKILFVFLMLLLFMPAYADNGIDDIEKFYLLVNDHRERIGLQRLEVDPGLEKYSAVYNERMWKAGIVSHNLMSNEELNDFIHALTDKDYRMINEVLQSGPSKYLSDFTIVFYNFITSPSHKRCLEVPGGSHIGANYFLTSDGVLLFSAYVGVLYD